MQINLLDSRIKTFIKSYLGWILFFLMVWLNAGAGKEIKTVKVIVPTVTGKLESKKPELKPLEIKQEPIVKKDGLVYKENPFNIILAEENTKLKAEIEQLKEEVNANKLWSDVVERTLKKEIDKNTKLCEEIVKLRGDINETKHR